LSVTISVEYAGTGIAEATGYAVPPRAAAEYTLIVIVAVAPVVLATTMLSILKTLPLEAALLTRDVAEVVVSEVVLVLP
jgi:hypothetical protein